MSSAATLLVVLIVAAVALVEGWVFSPLSLLAALLAVLVRERALNRRGLEFGTSLAAESLARRAVAMASQSPFEIIRESFEYHSDGALVDRVRECLRGYDVLAELETSGDGTGDVLGARLVIDSAPTASEVAGRSLLQVRRDLAHTSSSLEARHSLLQGLGFFIPLFILIFGANAASSVLNSLYLALSYGLLLDALRHWLG